ncbi:MAG: fumarylacetoacetate hydrolase family protein [Clostridia bacterium]|nr:fumarylacetoacetate hydrolase family protein [Clostridia bacterium]
MKFLRYAYEGKTSYGVLQKETVYPVEGDIYTSYTVGAAGVALQDVTLLVPCEPTKIIAVGLNYSDHAKEMKEEQRKAPVLFTKPTSSLLPHGSTILWPAASKQVDYEAELCVVIGKTADCVTPEEAEDYIFGYTCLNDVTARDLQKVDGQWTRAKGFKTFAPMGPYIETEADVSSLNIRLELNGEIKQQGNTDMMMFSPAELVSFVSEIMPLYPGDVITTGTPAGIGPMQHGDKVSVIIENIGTLTNYME